MSTTNQNSLLRFTTAGSVDDGKSTLIGRLLYDSKSIFEDQLEAVEKEPQERPRKCGLSLLTDGLRAEREQGITIDVAYRYFATPRRKFIIADTPGHVQYTRNMVTGASTADLAIIFIDARHGLVEQTHRHSFIASNLGIKHLVVCVNKMDLVDFDEDAYQSITSAYRNFSSRLDIPDIKFIDQRAVGRQCGGLSVNMPWYEGGTLLSHLKKCTSAATAICKIAASPSNTSSVPKPMRREISAGTPVESLRGCSRWATRWWAFRAACNPGSRKFSLSLRL